MRQSDRYGQGARALDRALDLFSAIVRDQGRSSLVRLAAELDLPISTAHRLLDRFEARGLLVRIGRGRYQAGLGLVRLADHVDRPALLARIARPLMRQHARASRQTLHLGVLDAEMVTYLVKEAGGDADIFSRESMQLEAYCSAVGKILLANLPKTALDAYLDVGSFVALTARTLTEPETLRAHLASVKCCDYAIDDGEIDDSIYCLAVPIRAPDGIVVAALSSSGTRGGDRSRDAEGLARLRDCAAAIEARLFPRTRGDPVRL